VRHGPGLLFSVHIDAADAGGFADGEEFFAELLREPLPVFESRLARDRLTVPARRVLTAIRRSIAAE